MKLLEENDWIFLNDIAYKVYSIDDFTKMRRSFLELLKLLIPYDIATFYLSEHESGHLLGRPVGVNVSEKELQVYTDQFEEIDYARWIFVSAKGMIYRETDLFPDSVREETALYKEMYAPNNLHFSVQLSLVHSGVFLGIASLYRSKEKEDFSEKDLFVLEMVKDHLAFRLYKEYLAERNTHKTPNLSAYSEQFSLTR